MSDSPASRFFASRGKPAPSRPVKLRLIQTVEGIQQVAEAEAVFRFVNDRETAEAETRAAAACATMNPVPTDGVREAVRQSYLLHEALRQKENPAGIFFDGADECRSMLVDIERRRLLGEYQLWKEREFPEALDPEKFKEAVADMTNFSMTDLLTKYGYDTVRLLLLSSLATRTTSPTP